MRRFRYTTKIERRWLKRSFHSPRCSALSWLVSCYLAAAMARCSAGPEGYSVCPLFTPGRSSSANSMMRLGIRCSILYDVRKA
jgi:hypothetical protein